MKQAMKRSLSILLSVVMVISIFAIAPMTTFASIANWEDTNVVYDGETFGTNGYYNVISKKDYVLVPGAAVESEMVLNNADGTRRQVIHVIEVDPSNPDVSIVPGYNQIDKDLTDEANWSHKELTEMAKYYEDNLGYNIVGGMNTDLYYDTYAPRILVYNGKDLSVKGKTTPSSSILYVFKDAQGNISCDVKAFNRTEFDSYLADGTLLHAVSVSFAMVVKDGALVTKTESRSSAAARSMVGVKEDGTLVICMNDGRGANNSVGFSDYEEGEAMLALGCKWAANCDGGGSSTFLTKRVGEDTFTMRSSPCDGAQRPTAHGIFVTSNVAPTGELDVINITADYDYFAPKTTYTFGAEAIDTHGYAMDMPANVTWSLSDDSFGTIENGKFVSNGTKGEVDIQVESDGKVVGTKTITVTDPEVFELSATSTVVPYSTADKVRTITLPIVATIGEDNVYIDTNAVTAKLSNSNAGTLDGYNFTATDDTTIKGVDVTVTYGSTSLVYAITFGKGSEVIWDFEDGNKGGFMGFEEAKQWSKDNSVNNTLVGSSPLDGQFNTQLSSKTFISTTTNGGQVRNGNNALAWRLDNTDADFANWSYNVLFNTGETIVLRDVENDILATTLGMWVYIPENAFPAAGKGLSFQSQLYVKNADGSYSCKQDHFTFTSAATGNKTNLNSATNADIPESRWVYMSIDISKYDYLCTPVATDTGNSRSPSFIRTYVKPDTADVVTFYIDDITLDYSSAVDDRVLPTITNPTYSTSDTAVTLENGATISGSNFAFSATVADNAALDTTSGKITVDGIEIKSSVAGGALSSTEDVVLGAGEHYVAFEIKDELGNPMKITRTFTVSGDAVVYLGGHNDSGETPSAASVYYVDINVANLADVDNLSAVLKLNNSNTWDTDGIIVADGYEATVEYNEVSELLTVNVERFNNASARSANKTLVSIPVRVWTYDLYDYVKEIYDDPAGYADKTSTYVSSNNRPKVDIECEVVCGVLNKTDSFAGSIDVATELTTISSPYHVHDAQLTACEDVDATCTTSGYTGRTYCESCQSVVDWGTIIDAKGHDYAIVDGQFVCQEETCGYTYVTTTGSFELGGDLYYSVNGVLKTGWQDMDGLYGYAGEDYKMYVDGEYTIDGITYTFAEDGTTAGAWTTNSKGTRYSVGPSFVKRSWVEIDGAKYYFGEDNYMYTGTRSIPKNRNNLDEGTFWYLFGEDGKYIKDYTDLNGIVEENGSLYWVVDGMNAYGGLMLIDGDYYYARTYGQLVMNKDYWITKTNGFLPATKYTFGADGKMINPPAVDEPDVEDPTETPDATEPQVNSGIVSEGGKLFWYVDGVKTYGGLMFIDGDYYYARTSGEILTNISYWITKTNDLLPAARYTFGADGKMVDAPVVDEPTEAPTETPEATEPAAKNGIVSENGKLFWYVDGAKTYAGLMLIDGDYYYARTSGELVTNRDYWITTTNDLLPAGKYTFGADGKMIDPPVVDEPDVEDPTETPDATEPAVKNGIVSEGGKLYWYVDGVKTYAGLMLIDGDYYYARTSGELVTNRDYWITTTNDLLPAGKYTFGADGKMVR